jgi:hypothetical protein
MELYRGVESRWTAWKAVVFPLDQYGLPAPSLLVEKAGIEPARQRLQGASGALPVIPVVVRRPVQGYPRK